MGTNELRVALGTIGEITNIDVGDVVEKLTVWNKEKIYPVTPIQINVTTDGVIDNAEQIGEIVEKIESYVDDVAKNALDLSEVEDAKKTVSEVGKYLIETRKIQTAPLKDVVGHYTQHEGKFKIFNESLAKKIDAMKEKGYQKAEVALRDHFQDVLIEQDLQEVLSMDIFKDFIENKRKTQFFTTKGALNKNIRDAVAEVIRVAYEPIKNAKEIEEKKAQQSKQFGAYLENIPTDAETNVLEASIISLERMKESVDEFYPDIISEAMRRIGEAISRCESNIRANKAQEEKEAVQNADGEALQELDVVREKLSDMTLSKEDLKEQHTILTTLFKKMTFVDNQDAVRKLGLSVNDRIVEIEKAEIEAMSKDVPAPEPAPTVNHDNVADSTEKVFTISIHDLEPLTYMEVKAENEEEAKAIFVQRFETHLSMVDLHTKKEG